MDQIFMSSFFDEFKRGRKLRHTKKKLNRQECKEMSACKCLLI